MSGMRTETTERCPICGAVLTRLPAGPAVKCPVHGVVGEVRLGEYAPIVTEPTIVAQRVTAIAVALYR